MLQRLDPGGYDISSSTTILFNAKFNDDNSFVGVSATTPAGRSNTYGYTTSLSGAFLGWFTGNYAQAVFGFAYYNPFSTFTNNKQIATFQDLATQQIDVRTDGSGHLFITRAGTTLGSVSTSVLSTGWHYIEIKALIAGGTSGSCELKVDNVVWCTATGVNTKVSANAYANRFYVASFGSGTQYWKDIYILDTATGINTNYLGDIKVVTLYPASADGTFQQWAANTGTQVAAVQDGKAHSGSFPDDDTAYIFDTVSGHISAFAVDTLSAGTIFGVIHAVYARTASTGTINQVLVQGGSVVETSATITLTTSYHYYFDIQEQNPTGPATWTNSSVNATHPGVKIQATSASARVSQELLLVAVSNLIAAASSPSQLWIIT